MFVLRRLGSALPTLFAVSLLVFFFVDLIPGDPAQILAGPTASNEEIESIRKFLGLNEPLLDALRPFPPGHLGSVCRDLLPHASPGRRRAGGAAAQHADRRRSAAWRSASSSARSPASSARCARAAWPMRRSPC